MAILSFSVLSKCIGRHITINAFIPTLTISNIKDGINPYQKTSKLKVLWLLHGFTGSQDDFLINTNIARYAQKQNIAVIMPPAFNGGYSDNFSQEKYMSFIVEELVEVCSYLLPISTEREDMKLAGLSMGSMGAMKIAMAFPNKYSEVLCMSGVPYHFNDEIHHLNWFGDDKSSFKGTIPGQGKSIKDTLDDAYSNAENNVQQNISMPRFYLTVGSYDFFVQRCRDAFVFLNQLGIDITYNEVENYDHEWDFWDMQLRYALENWFTL